MHFNHIKTGGTEYTYSLAKRGGAFGAPPRKRPYRIGIGLKCMFIVWVLERVEKMPKKGSKK